MGAHLKLGTPLSIDLGGKMEKYEDLDEVVARYVEPYVENFRALVRHRKFRDGLWPDMQVALLFCSKLEMKPSLGCVSGILHLRERRF
jgi:SH2 domain